MTIIGRSKQNHQFGEPLFLTHAVYLKYSIRSKLCCHINTVALQILGHRFIEHLFRTDIKTKTCTKFVPQTIIELHLIFHNDLSGFIRKNWWEEGLCYVEHYQPV